MMSGCHLRTILPVLLVLAGCGDQLRPPAEAESARLAAANPAPVRPTSRGLDSLRLEQAYAEAAAMPRMRSLLVARHGEILREAYFGGARREGHANIKSASKSVVSTLVGIAIAEGHLQGVDQPIAHFFERYLGEGSDPRKQAITIGNLLSMQSGLEPTSGRNYGAWVSSPNWVRHAIGRPMVTEPGGRMLYSTGSTHLLSAILAQATGMSTYAYARERLAKPIGIELRPWPTDPQGVYFGGNEMRMRPRDMVRFGELYRNGGVWEGKRILPEEWIRQSWTPRTSSPYNGHRYGYGWWIRKSSDYPVYFAWGYGGQFIFVVPELELTVVTTSVADAPREGDHLREIHALLDRWIVPAAEAGSATTPAALPDPRRAHRSGRSSRPGQVPPAALTTW